MLLQFEDISNWGSAVLHTAVWMG